MLSSLLTAMTSNDAKTANGMATNSTTGSGRVDLFGAIGSLRAQSEESVIKMFARAYGESKLDAMRILFYARDVRGGQGERKTFRTLVRYLAKTEPSVLVKNLHLIPVYGRWDDLFELIGTPLETEALRFYSAALVNSDRLAAKWAPREKSSKSLIAHKLTKVLGVTPKQYRKRLAELTQVVETAMCSGAWDDIKFDHVPSVAMKNYRKAFEKNAPQKWLAYTEALAKGEVKVNASALFPHDIVKGILTNYSPTVPQRNLINAQWKALPNYFAESGENVLPVVDVSGSMSVTIDPKSSLQAIHISLALGLYCAERNNGIFKDHFVTFSNQPKLQKLAGDDIINRCTQLRQVEWGMNTNLTAVFDLILNAAVKHKVPVSDMPTMLLILSDMEFDSCASLNAMEMIEAKYAASGYKAPKIVFWNLNARPENNPVKAHKNGAALVSGYSPSILGALLGVKIEEFTPEGVMRKTIDGPRYEAVAV